MIGILWHIFASRLILLLLSHLLNAVIIFHYPASECGDLSSVVLPRILSTFAYT